MKKWMKKKGPNGFIRTHSRATPSMAHVARLFYKIWEYYYYIKIWMAMILIFLHCSRWVGVYIGYLDHETGACCNRICCFFGVVLLSYHLDINILCWGWFLSSMVHLSQCKYHSILVIFLFSIALFTHNKLTAPQD